MIAWVNWNLGGHEKGGNEEEGREGSREICIIQKKTIIIDRKEEVSLFVLRILYPSPTILCCNAAWALRK